jgi:hypothetical protein
MLALIGTLMRSDFVFLPGWRFGIALYGVFAFFPCSQGFMKMITDYYLGTLFFLLLIVGVSALRCNHLIGYLHSRRFFMDTTGQLYNIQYYHYKDLNENAKSYLKSVLNASHAVY